MSAHGVLVCGVCVTALKAINGTLKFLGDHQYLIIDQDFNLVDSGELDNTQFFEDIYSLLEKQK